MRDSYGIQVRFVVGSSGMLARQIENGAPYDVYLSANERFVQELAAQRVLDVSTVRVYAEGRLGLWSKDGKIRELKQLTGAGVRHIAIANPQHAPYGAAAKQALTRAGLWAAIERRIVYAENVRQAFEYASSGNTDAVVTAWSLVHHRSGVLLDSTLYDPLRQAGAVVASSKQRAAAQKLLDYLCGARGQAVLASYGWFAPPASCAKIGEPR